MKLLLPVSGKSTRYPDMRPKWLLTFPNGQLMIERSLSGLNLDNINEIVLIMLKEHTKHIKEDFIINTLSSSIGSKIKVTVQLLNNQTPSQPSTIVKYLKSQKDDFSFYIKDSDNYFNFMPIEGNSVTFIPLDSLDYIDANSKSYISVNRFNEVELVAEKKVISDKFCCGGYSFKSSEEFIKTYKDLGGDSNLDLYVSHIIQKNLLDGIKYEALEAQNYEDYGTSKDFFRYTSQVNSIFCDFDGVLVQNSSKFAEPAWDYIPNEENLKHIFKVLEKSSDSRLIITTSRPSKEKQNIIDFLKKYSITTHHVVTDLPHCQRILVNDFSKTNPYPSAKAINIPRDSSNLSNYLD